MAGNILGEKPPANVSYQDFLPASSTNAGNILGEKSPANVSYEDFSPGPSTSHASDYEQHQPANTVTHRTLHITVEQGNVTLPDS